MDIDALLRRSESRRPAKYQGEWAVLLLRPDLGSLQEFVVGVAAIGDAGRLVLRWLRGLVKLSDLYGGRLSVAATADLFIGVERAMIRSFRGGWSDCDTGSPNIRLQAMGYLAAEDLRAELGVLLKRHAAALWTDADECAVQPK